jgi:hypothetical protein
LSGDTRKKVSTKSVRVSIDDLEEKVMSSTSGIQQLSNAGLLPSSISQSVLGKASAVQLNQIAGSGLALQQVNALFGTGGSSTDSATLSPAASALIQEINPSQDTIGGSTGTDPLTQAVSNELTSSLNAAVNQFLPQNSSANGTRINLLA